MHFLFLHINNSSWESVIFLQFTEFNTQFLFFLHINQK